MIRETCDGVGHRVEIGQRFAHAHKHEIGQSFAFAQVVLSEEHLVDNLMGAEITLKSEHARQAKPAIEGTAHLCREAEGQPIDVGDQNAFDLIAVGQRQDEFPGAVLRCEDLDVSSSPDGAAVGQMCALLLRKIRHLGEGVDAFLVQPAQDLLRAESRPAE